MESRLPASKEKRCLEPSGPPIAVLETWDSKLPVLLFLGSLISCEALDCDGLGACSQMAGVLVLVLALAAVGGAIQTGVISATVAVDGTDEEGRGRGRGKWRRVKWRAKEREREKEGPSSSTGRSRCCRRPESQQIRRAAGGFSPGLALSRAGGLVAGPLGFSQYSRRGKEAGRRFLSPEAGNSSGAEPLSKTDSPSWSSPGRTISSGSADGAASAADVWSAREGGEGGGEKRGLW